MYRNETNITFQRNTLRFQRTGSRFSQIFFNSIRKKKFLVVSLTISVPRQILEQIVTADETWMHYYEPESKAQSMAWKRPTSPVAKKFKSQPSTGKIWKMRFWFISFLKVKPLTARTIVMYYERRGKLSLQNLLKT
jgi:hypothetical protein